MIWHIVRFDFSAIDAATREELEAALAGLTEMDVVEWLRVGRDVENPEITGLITALADEDALAAYRVHPQHTPVVARIRELGIPTVRVDLPTDDDPATLP